MGTGINVQYMCLSYYVSEGALNNPTFLQVVQTYAYLKLMI